jgi:glyoxylase-like metal-dependent hydrolase (beta-lactamase superfamily II)/rhodanese-related sulfurtransferase
MTNVLSQSMTIDVDELQGMLATKAPVTVLDVRKSEDRAEWAIPGSLHINAYEALQAGAPSALDDVAIPKDAPVVTVCGAGKMSFTAMERLRARGYDARSLQGGMKAWSLAWNSAVVPVPGSEATVVQIRRTGKGCLSYLVGHGDQAAVIDASLAPRVYETIAAEHGWTITDVLDTHVHADHLSRSPLLAAVTGATLHLPDQDRVSYAFTPISDGDSVSIGSSRIVALRTPGHTRESTCYLLDGRALFSGDTLFLAGVGRPDLEASVAEARERARLLHASLRRVLTLPREMLLLPGHASEPAPFDEQPIAATLAQVACRVEMLALTEEPFLAAILARIPPTPPNHAQIVALNEAGVLPDGDLTDLEAGANRCAVA